MFREAGCNVNQSAPATSNGWFKAMRGNDALELIRKNPNAYALAAVIANRARWREGFNADGLEQGEAMLGDYREYGMTRQEYRTALAHLCKNSFATTRTTNAGTIARLTDARLFDPLNLAGNQPDNQQPTIAQPPASRQATTNEEGKQEKKVKDDSLRGVRLKNPQLVELMDLCREVLGKQEMELRHKRWLERAEQHPDKLRRVLNDTRNKAKEDGLDNPAAWAEKMWKEFAPKTPSQSSK
jgi:hypothetical protein